jgi:hypothetical protein
MMRKPNHGALTAAVALLLRLGVRLLVRHGWSRESPLLFQRRAVVRRLRYCIPEEQSPAAAAAAVAKQ